MLPNHGSIEILQAFAVGKVQGSNSRPLSGCGSGGCRWLHCLALPPHSRTEPPRANHVIGIEKLRRPDGKVRTFNKRTGQPFLPFPLFILSRRGVRCAGLSCVRVFCSWFQNSSRSLVPFRPPCGIASQEMLHRPKMDG